jgi:phage antirepressor YoqD-like protein
MPEPTGTTSLLGEGTGAEGASGAGGGNPPLPGWQAGLPDGLKGHEALKGFAKVGDFATAALAWKERSEKSIQPLGQNATEAERQVYYKALGVPDKEDGYTFDPKKLPAGMEPNPEFDTYLRQVAKKAALTPAQAQEIYTAMHARVQQGLAKQQEEDRKAEADAKAAVEKNEADLHIRFGNDFKPRVAGAGKFARDLAHLAEIKVEDLNTWLKERELDQDAIMIRLLDAGARHVKPDQLVRGNGQQQTTTAAKTGLSYPWMRDFYGMPQE